MQVHIQNDGPVTIELESPAPGAAGSDPKQVSLEPGAWIRLEGDVTCLGLILVSGVVLILRWRKHFMDTASRLFYFLSSQEYMFTLSLLSRSQAWPCIESVLRRKGLFYGLFLG